MSLSNTTVKAIYTGDGSNLVFAIPATNIVDDSSEILVYTRDEATPTIPVVALMSEGALNDYTLTGAPDVNSFNVNVTFNVGKAPTATQKVVVIRRLPLTQILDLVPTGAVPLVSMELAYDRIVAMAQELREELSRSVKANITTSRTEVSFEIPEPRTGRVLAWKSTDDGFEWVVPASGGGGVGGGSSAWGGITGTLSDQTDLQTALNLKANLASPTFTGVPAAPTATLGTNTTQLATTAFVLANGGTPADASTTVKGIVKLAGDLAGTALLPTVPGLAGKEPTITATISTDYYRGDKTFQALNKAAVGLSNVDNTSDASKPVSTATQTALNLKADIASPTFTGTVGGITAAMVGAPSGSGTSSGTNTGDETATTLGSKIDAATSKATPVDADEVAIADSAASFILKKLTWLNLKATLKTYFDTLYPSGSGTSTGTNTGDQTNILGNAATVTTNANLTGPVTSTGNATAVTANAITDAMLAQIATASFKGRTTAGTGNVEVLTATQATAILNNVVGDAGAGGTKGLVPAPGAGDAAAGKMLKADGTWATPPGAGSGTTVYSGQTEIDFGAFPGASDASIVVTGQTNITTTARITVHLTAKDTADHLADEHWVENIAVSAGNIVASTSFTIYAKNTNSLNEPIKVRQRPISLYSASATTIGIKNAQPGVFANEGGKGTRLYGLWTVSWSYVL